MRPMMELAISEFTKAMNAGPSPEIENPAAPEVARYKLDLMTVMLRYYDNLMEKQEILVRMQGKSDVPPAEMVNGFTQIISSVAAVLVMEMCREGAFRLSMETIKKHIIDDLDANTDLFAPYEELYFKNVKKSRAWKNEERGKPYEVGKGLDK